MMKTKNYIVVLSAAALSLVGCISAERKAEYQAWRVSDDGISTASIETFEAQYKIGWQERAAEKKKVRLDKEAKEAAERERLAKERAEANRVRRAKEAAERAEKMRLAMRTELYDKTVERDLASIRLGNWASLGKLASLRLNLSEADALAGEALLSEFGAKYLPNAYANYEKRREALAELQQVFNEEFPQPWAIKKTNPKWNSFNKVLEKFVKARTEYFLCHDELCHYWLLSRFGVLTDKEFSKIDTQRLAVHLLPENVAPIGYELLKMNTMERKIEDFAIKYTPESNAIYQKMEREFKETDALLTEVFHQRMQLDDVRYSRVLTVAVAKRNELVRELNTLLRCMQVWQMDHRMTEKSSEEVARLDSELAKQLRSFVDSLPNYVKERALGPVISNSDLVTIPRQRYRMLRTEITQFKWIEVMGCNPSKYGKYMNCPVDNVTWDECQKFIKQASLMDGRKYRLPSEKAWEYSCRAGSTGDWGMRRNGECGPIEDVGWCRNNTRSGEGTHAVATKEPNAWGLFDMHGNVREWCQDKMSDRYDSHLIRGGDYCADSNECSSSFRDDAHPGWRSIIGFRLMISEDEITKHGEQ